MGGSVLQFGKPNPRHFLACLDNLKIPYDTQQQQQQQQSILGVAHVGDSLEHDVVGANAAGIDSIFVLGGIHAEELGLVPTGSSEGVGIVVVDNDDVNVGSDGVDGGGDVVVLNVGEGKQSIVSRKVLTEKLELFFEQKGIWPAHVIPSLSLDHFDTDLSQP